VIRVLLVADSAAARAGLADLLAGDGRLDVARAGLAPGDLDRLVGLGSADVVVAEMHPEDERVTGALLALVAEGAAPPVVAVVDDEGGAWTSEALRAGVRAVLPRDVSPPELQAAVAAAAAGLVVLRPADLAAPSRAVPAREALPQAIPLLTPRELEVLRLLAEGLGNKSIAARLRISERTVKFHVGAIFERLGVTSRTEAVTAGLRRGLILL
jgi:NarL family two-component system response regulator YdfI